jgi:hypothetical protein
LHGGAITRTVAFAFRWPQQIVMGSRSRAIMLPRRVPQQFLKQPAGQVFASKGCLMVR